MGDSRSGGKEAGKSSREMLTSEKTDFKLFRQHHWIHFLQSMSHPSLHSGKWLEIYSSEEQMVFCSGFGLGIGDEYKQQEDYVDIPTKKLQPCSSSELSEFWYVRLFILQAFSCYPLRVNGKGHQGPNILDKNPHYMKSVNILWNPRTLGAELWFY